jgi:hypothetical protein
LIQRSYAKHGWRESGETKVRFEVECPSEILTDSRLDTHLYGMGSTEDGLWRNKDGNEAKEAIGKDPGRFSWAKGIVGAVQRVRGVGGF